MLLRRIAPWGRTLAGVSLLLSLGAMPALAQDDEEIQRHGIFLDSLDVSLVNVEVHATQDGIPVSDLTIEDFEVFDDGKPVEITNFYRVEAGRRVSSDVEPAIETLDVEAVELPSEEPSAVVVVVDHPFISPMSRHLVFENLDEQLESLLDAGTEVMVVSKTRTVEIAQELTADPRAVRQTLDSLREKAASDHATAVQLAIQEIELAPVLAQSRQSGRGGGGAAQATAEADARKALQIARAHSDKAFADVQHSLDLLRDLLGSLAGLPGRKAVLYVADRLPLRSGELVWRAWYERYGLDWGTRLGAPTVDAALLDYDSSVVVRELIATANANRVAFYPIGVGADAGPNLSSAANRGGGSTTRFFMRNQENNQGLRWLANGTGGRPAIGRGDVAGFFQDLHQDLTDYYSLAWASPHRGDGDNHKIEIRVKRPGVEVRFLSEYQDKSADQQMADQTLSALVFGLGENPLDVRVKVGDPKSKKRGEVAVPLEVQVPVANLVLVPGRETHVGKISVQMVVRDPEGRLSDSSGVRIPIEIPHASMLDAVSEVAAWRTELTLREGPQTLAVGVRDELGSTSSLLRLDLDTERRR